MRKDPTFTFPHMHPVYTGSEIPEVAKCQTGQLKQHNSYRANPGVLMQCSRPPNEHIRHSLATARKINST